MPVVFGVPGPLRTLELSGPAAGKSGEFTLKDIASTPSGGRLFVIPATLGNRLAMVNSHLDTLAPDIAQRGID